MTELPELNESELALRKRLINLQQCFTKFKPSEIDVLATLFVEQAFRAGDIIVEEGDHVDSVYIIVKGKANVIKTHFENHVEKNVKVAELNDQNAIGLNEQGFYSFTGLRTATVIANTDMITLKLSVVLFRGFALAYPHASEVMREQAERI